MLTFVKNKSHIAILYRDQGLIPAPSATLVKKQPIWKCEAPVLVARVLSACHICSQSTSDVENWTFVSYTSSLETPEHYSTKLVKSTPKVIIYQHAVGFTREKIYKALGQLSLCVGTFLRPSGGNVRPITIWWYSRLVDTSNEHSWLNAVSAQSHEEARFNH